MRRVAQRGLVTMAAAGGMLAAVSGYAHADSGAIGVAKNSPGIGSGNTVQAPVHAPVNVCGNTVNVVGLLNPAFGNDCGNGGRHHGGHHGSGGHGGSGPQASGHAAHSPGVASGNTIQAPVDAPVNVCGNSVDVAGLMNPVFGNDCGNEARPQSPHQPPHHPPHHPGKPKPPGSHQPPTPGHPHQPGTPHNPGTPGGPGSTPGGHHGPHGTGPSDDTGLQPQTETQRPTGGKSAIVATPKPGAHLAQTGAGMVGYAVPMSAGLLLGGAVLYRRARTARR